MADEKKVKELRAGAYFLASADVKVFPSGRRLTDFDPEARMNSEYNLTNLGLAGANTYLISNNLGAGQNLPAKIIFMLGGYHFELSYIPNQLISLFKDTTQDKDIYCVIKKNPFTYYETTYHETKTTIILSKFQYSTEADIGSDYLDIDIDNNTEYYFTALLLTSDTSGLDATDYIKLFTVTATGDLNLFIQSELPHIKNDLNGGKYSVIVNDLTHNAATGDYAVAFGYNTEASGNYSFATGDGTKATEVFAVATGKDTVAEGEGSHAEGKYTIASGEASHAEGRGNGTSSGKKTTASGLAAHAEGYKTLASKQAAHAEGEETEATGNNSHAEGKYTIASKEAAHAEGCHTEASGINAHAEGELTTASGIDAHAEGCYTKATGDYAHAEGGCDPAPVGETQPYNTASGTFSHTEGWETKALAKGAHAEGYKTIAGVDDTTGQCAHAEGDSTSAIGKAAHAEGNNTIANHRSQHVFGEYNIADSSIAAATEQGTYIEIVGNGTADNARANARTLDWSGNEYLAGSLAINNNLTITNNTTINSLTKGTAVVVKNDDTKVLESRTISDSSSASALDSSSDNFVTERDVYNGLPNINNTHDYTSSSTLYGPTAGGTNGNLLVSTGPTGTPTWLANCEPTGTYILKGVSNNNPAWSSVSSPNNTASYGNAVTVGTVADIDLKFTMPSDDKRTAAFKVKSDSTDVISFDQSEAKTLTLAADDNITLTPNNNTITIKSSYVNTTYTIIGGSNQGEVTLQDNGGNNTTITVTNLGTNGTPSFNSVTTGSDIRLKKDIKDYTCKKSILDLPIKEYNLISDNTHHIGCIAQDLQEICPEIVHMREDGYLAIEESKIVYLLLDEVRKLKEEVKKLKRK